MAQARYERLSTDASQPNEEIELRTHNSDNEFNHGNELQKSNDTDDRSSYMDDRQRNHETTLRIPGSQIKKMACWTIIPIMIYILLSISLTFYQRYVLKKYQFPFTIVTYHLVIKFILASCVRSAYKWKAGKTRVLLDFRTSLRKMAPTGIASGIDIGFSNWGLELVRVSLYTMTKSSTIVFILFFAILLGLEKKSTLLVFTVGLIAAGLVMFTYESTQFNTLGFMFILIASLSSGIRWSFAQFLMQKTKLGLHSPIDMIYHMQPWMIASLVPFVIALESKKLYEELIKQLPTAEPYDVFKVIAEITLGAKLAFLMEVSEFEVLSRTSGLTLSIAGIFKDFCQVVLAVEYNGDNLSFINIIGLFVCLAGISCHVFHKYITLLHSENVQALEDGSFFNEDSKDNIPNGVGTSTEHISHHHHHLRQQTQTTVSNLNKHSALTVPLLEQMDSNESSDDSDGPNASDVIFDVLKRRDMSR